MSSETTVVAEALIVWSQFGLSTLLIGAIAFLTLRDLLKYDKEHLSVLKDHYTVFFVTIALSGLLFKLAIVETHLKGEVENPRRCSMFISDYLPQFFITICSILVAVKGILLAIVNKDTYSSYIENKHRRLKVAAYVTTPIYVVLFICMNMRFMLTCYRELSNKFTFIADIELKTEY